MMTRRPGESGRRRFEVLRLLYQARRDDLARSLSLTEVADACGLPPGEASLLLSELVLRALASREAERENFSITAAGIRVIERTLGHRPHTIP